MDLDLDLDMISWPLDLFPNSNSNPPTPFSPFVSEQPCSPLWTFSDSDNKDNIDHLKSITKTCTSNKVSDSPNSENEDYRKFSSSIDNYCLLKERMTQALRYLESKEHHGLAQIWAPVKSGGQYVLTTSGQPFVLDPHTIGMNQYRTVSLMYMFSVDGLNDGQLGLPGRVFQQKMPEWSPNVQYYSNKEFSRRDHALHYNVQGTLALPLFEPSGYSCVGVLELIMTSPKIHYAPEVDKVCKAFQAVNLRSSEILDHPNTQICNEGRQNALAEILEILNAVSETHKLPLAQTWVPCKHRSVLTYGGGLKKSCSSFDGSCMGKVCMSASDIAFYIVDAHIWGFREACVEHHLQKGQGVAGRAFSSQNSCFCTNVTQLCKTEYPLVHYARMFGLTSCFAICLRSSHTGDDEYILEFFLPPTINDKHEQVTLLGSLLATMKQHFHSLNIASGMELEDDECSVEVIEGSANGKFYSRLEYIQIPKATGPPHECKAVSSAVEILPLDSSKLQILEEVNDVRISENKETKKTPDRKRGKAEISISLDVIQQYFSGSLKDAAKSLGVCPTTMKRICRHHGISRWPSRKINKVNRSLSNLKCVIESVQGASLPPLSANHDGTISYPSNVNDTDQHNSPSNKQHEPEFANVGVDDNLVGVNILSQGGVNGNSPELDKREESAGSPTSHGSCQVSLVIHQQCTKMDDFELESQTIEKLTKSAMYSIIDDDLLASEPFGAMLIEDAGSSKDLRNLCPSVEEINEESSWSLPKIPLIKKSSIITIKATYMEDIIRFRISTSCDILELKEEVAKRVKLEMGTFDIKYMDDDQEWVSINCDADLQECVDILRSSSKNMLRLLINDAMPNLGSSFESTARLS
ncbi:hypothetical protein ACFE04_015591 [Oxalis oulophora]